MPKTKTRPRQQVEEDLELEEVDEDVEETKPKAKKRRGGAAQEVEFGVSDLAEYLKTEHDKEYTTRDLRTLIRKMAREEKARVNREIVPGNKSRYNWPGGLDHPEVKAVIAAVTAGEVEQGRKEALDKLKTDKAKKDAARPRSAKKTKAVIEEPDDEELEELDEDEE